MNDTNSKMSGRFSNFFQSLKTGVEATRRTTIQASEIAKQKSHQIMENAVKPGNNLVSTIRSTSRVAKWSVLLISGGIFLFGLSKVIVAVNESYEKYSDQYNK